MRHVTILEPLRVIRISVSTPKSIPVSMPYLEALKLQQEATPENRGRLLLFMPSSAVITVGRRFMGRLPVDVWREPKANDETIEVLGTMRGGGVSFHGPGQWLIFPIGGLVDFGYESTAVKAFIDDVILVFKQYINIYIEVHAEAALDKPALIYQRDGIFSKDGSRKFLSVGLRVQRSHMEHGFCLNMWPAEPFNDWSERLIICDMPHTKLSSLYSSKPDACQIEVLANGLLSTLELLKKPIGTINKTPKKLLEP